MNSHNTNNEYNKYNNDLKQNDSFNHIDNLMDYTPNKFFQIFPLSIPSNYPENEDKENNYLISNQDNHQNGIQQIEIFQNNNQIPLNNVCYRQNNNNNNVLNSIDGQQEQGFYYQQQQQQQYDQYNCYQDNINYQPYNSVNNYFQSYNNNHHNNKTPSNDIKTSYQENKTPDHTIYQKYDNKEHQEYIQNEQEKQAHSKGLINISLNTLVQQISITEFSTNEITDLNEVNQNQIQLFNKANNTQVQPIQIINSYDYKDKNILLSYPQQQQQQSNLQSENNSQQQQPYQQQQQLQQSQQQSQQYFQEYKTMPTVNSNVINNQNQILDYNYQQQQYQNYNYIPSYPQQNQNIYQSKQQRNTQFYSNQDIYDQRKYYNTQTFHNPTQLRIISTQNIDNKNKIIDENNNQFLANSNNQSIQNYQEPIKITTIHSKDNQTFYKTNVQNENQINNNNNHNNLNKQDKTQQNQIKQNNNNNNKNIINQNALKQTIDDKTANDDKVINTSSDDVESDSSSENNKDEVKGCNCRNSKCLKRYCDCFAAGQYCIDSCKCFECHNKSQYEDLRQIAIQKKKKRIKNAFQPVIQNNTHIKGCHCKNSHCQKNYCVCYLNGVQCSSLCQCIECENILQKCNHQNNTFSIDDQKQEQQQQLQQSSIIKISSPSLKFTSPIQQTYDENHNYKNNNVISHLSIDHCLISGNHQNTQITHLSPSNDLTNIKKKKNKISILNSNFQQEYLQSENTSTIKKDNNNNINNSLINNNINTNNSNIYLSNQSHEEDFSSLKKVKKRRVLKSNQKQSIKTLSFFNEISPEDNKYFVNQSLNHHYP